MTGWQAKDTFVMRACPGCDAWTLEHDFGEDTFVVEAILRAHMADCPRLASIFARVTSE